MRDKPYCNAPWLGLYYEGTVGIRPCCEWKPTSTEFSGNYKQYTESEYLKRFKEFMYRDKTHPSCIECIHNEKVGGHSRRKYYGQWDNDVDLEAPGIDRIIRLDYRAGNKCNMMCRMCSPQSSSLLEEEVIENGDQEIGFIKHIDTSDVYDLDLSDCEEISILGGEPSIDLKVRKFMNYVADNYPNIKIVVTTNATNSSEKWFKTLLRFCRGAGLQIILSVDAAGATQDFQRSGGDWNKIKKNIQKYKEISDSAEYNCGASIQLTATALNMTTLDQWWDELVDVGVKIEINQVWWPKGMAIGAIPDEYKKQSIEFIKDWLQQFTDPQPNDIDTKNKIYAAKAVTRILKGTEYSIHSQREFVTLQNRYDNYRSENVRDLDDRFKAMMI